jgi:hypothetical protein
MDDGQEQEMAVGRLERGKRKLQRVMNKSVRRWMIVIYKQALVLIRQAFKMVTDLEKNGGDVVGNSDNSVIRDLIEKTRHWLVQQMGKKFPSLSADPPPPPVVGRRGRGKKVRSSSSAVVAAADTSSSSSPPPSPPQ